MSELFDECRYDITRFSQRFLDIDPTEPQKKWFSEEPWSVIRMWVAGARSGKSTAGAIKLLHHALFQTRPPKYAHMTHKYILVNVALTLDMASIVFNIALNTATDSHIYRQFLVEKDLKMQPFPQIVVGDGKRGQHGFRSEIWARSSGNPTYLLGKNFDGCCFDESASQPDGLKVLEDVLLMRLVDRSGRLDMISTGNGLNWYRDMYLQTQVSPESMRPAHYMFGMSSSSRDNPHIDQDRININAERLSPEAKMQQIDGLFADINGVFNSFDIEKCYKGQDYSIPIAGITPVEGATYCTGWDFGGVLDPSVCLVARVDVTPAELVYCAEFGGRINPQSFVGDRGVYNQVSKIYHRYPGPVYGDTTGPAGKLIFDTLNNEYGVPLKESDVAGQRGEAKKSLVLSGRNALQGRKIVFPYVPATKPLIDELRFYQLKDVNLKTDYVFAFCILAEGMRKESYIEEEVPNVPSVWAKAGTQIEGCNCRLTSDLAYCLQHHMPIKDSLCCGMEEELRNMIVPQQVGNDYILNGMGIGMDDLYG